MLANSKKSQDINVKDMFEVIQKWCIVTMLKMTVLTFSWLADLFIMFIILVSLDHIFLIGSKHKVLLRMMQMLLVLQEFGYKQSIGQIQILS